jgi:hypothetical protein
MVMQRSELIPIKIGSKTALKPGGTMSQPISFTLDLELPFEDVFEKVTTALKDEGFGVLTKIDVNETETWGGFPSLPHFGCMQSPFGSSCTLKHA